MDSWFGATSTYGFTLFATSHLIALTIAFVGFVALLAVKKLLTENLRFFQWLRWSLFSLLFFSEVTYQYWALSNGVWRFDNQMPLHLCGIASLVAMIGLVTMRPLWIRLSFYLGVFPAFLALVTPELPYDFQHFRFWKFFIHHIAISWACLFLALSRPTLITLRSVFTTYGLLLIYAAVIGFLINPWSDANFLFLTQRPTTTSPLDFFGQGVWYYINLCLITLGLFTLQYFLFRKFVN